MDNARKRHSTTPYGFEHLVSTRIEPLGKFIRTDLSERLNEEAVRRVARQAMPLFHRDAVWIINAWGVAPFDIQARQPMVDLIGAFKIAQGRSIVLLLKDELATLALIMGAKQHRVALSVHFSQDTFNKEIDRLKVTVAP